jgi:hypothetical protein
MYFFLETKLCGALRQGIRIKIRCANSHWCGKLYWNVLFQGVVHKIFLAEYKFGAWHSKNHVKHYGTLRENPRSSY